MKQDRQPNIRQRLAVKNALETREPWNKSMIKAGYSSVTANTPNKLTKTDSYKALLYEYGLTEELISKSLVQDIKSKKGKRVQELTLGANMLGMTKHDEATENFTPIQINIIQGAEGGSTQPHDHLDQNNNIYPTTQNKEKNLETESLEEGV